MENSDSIFVIGSGAIGKALAVFLKLAGRNAVLIRGSVDEGVSQTERFRVEAEGGIVHEADVDVTTLSSYHKLNGPVVLANKSFGNERLATLLAGKTDSSPIVLLQNGLGVERPFMTDLFPNIFRCVLFVTCQSIGENFIRFKPVATCPVGVEKGELELLKETVCQLDTKFFRFHAEADIQTIVWKKAIANSVFNSVCTLLEVDNGIFHRDRTAREMAKRIITQCVRVAEIKGIHLRVEDVEENLLRISKASDGQLISTLQDIRSGRRTEIDTLNLEIARLAEELGKGDWVQETKLLGELTKLKETIRMNGNH